MIILANILINSSNATATAIWDSSVALNSVISKQKDSFTEFTSVLIYKVISGPIPC